MLCNQNDYIEAKGNLINRIEREGNIKGLSDGVKRLEYLAPESATNDSDIEWIKIVVKTKNFTKHMPIKKSGKTYGSGQRDASDRKHLFQRQVQQESN